MKSMVNFNIKRTAAAISAAVMLTSSAAVIPASAETAPAYSAIEYSISGLSTPKITKAAKTTNSVTLKWTKVKGAAGYKVYKKVGNRYKVCGTVRGGSKVRFKVKKLKSGAKYSFKVRAYKKSGKKLSWSKYSKAKAVTTKSAGELKAYNKFLADFPDTWRGDKIRSVRFRTIDMNNDGIKELYLDIAGEHTQSISTLDCIFGFRNGKVVPLFGHYNEKETHYYSFRYFPTRVLCYGTYEDKNFTNDYTLMDTYYAVYDGKKLVNKLRYKFENRLVGHTFVDTRTYYKYEDGREYEITKLEYDRIAYDLTDGHSSNDPDNYYLCNDTHENTPENRSKYLK